MVASVAIWTIIGLLALTLLWSTLLALVGACIPHRQTHAEANETSLPHPGAAVFVVRNESSPSLEVHLLAAHMCNNGMEVWLVSDATTDLHALNLYAELGEKHSPWLKVWQRKSHRGAKRGALTEWYKTCGRTLSYEFILLCDADTHVDGSCFAALYSAFTNPDNNEVAIFQSSPLARPAETYFSRGLHLAHDLASLLYLRATQKLFGHCPFLGSAALIRPEAYFSVRVPDQMLSHDIWDTALLSQQASKPNRCCLVAGAVSHQSFPASYADYISRELRWMTGTLQAASLVFSPRLPWTMRYQIAWACWAYCVPILLFSLMVCSWFSGEASIAQHFGVGSSMLSAAVLMPAYGLGLAALPVAYGWQACLGLITATKAAAIAVLGKRRTVAILTELVYSTILLVNNIVILGTFFPVCVYRIATKRIPIWHPTPKHGKPRIRHELYVSLLPCLCGIVFFALGTRGSIAWIRGSFVAVLWLLSPLTICSSSIRQEDKTDERRVRSRFLETLICTVIVTGLVSLFGIVLEHRLDGMATFMAVIFGVGACRLLLGQSSLPQFLLGAIALGLFATVLSTQLTRTPDLIGHDLGTAQCRLIRERFEYHEYPLMGGQPSPSDIIVAQYPNRHKDGDFVARGLLRSLLGAGSPEVRVCTVAANDIWIEAYAPNSPVSNEFILEVLCPPWISRGSLSHWENSFRPEVSSMDGPIVAVFVRAPIEANPRWYRQYPLDDSVASVPWREFKCFLGEMDDSWTGEFTLRTGILAWERGIKDIMSIDEMANTRWLCKTDIVVWRAAPERAYSPTAD